MKETLAAYKEEHPELSHKESFAAVRVFLSFRSFGSWGSGGFSPCLSSPRRLPSYFTIVRVLIK